MNELIKLLERMYFGRPIENASTTANSIVKQRLTVKPRRLPANHKVMIVDILSYINWTTVQWKPCLQIRNN
jgi:hypothetical protein